LPCLLSLGQGQCSISSPCCQCVMMVCCLFFNFVGQFDFGCCSLAQKMSSVISYLPLFREWLITHLLLAWPSCLSSVCLLIVHAKISSLPLPPSPMHSQLSCPLCYCSRLQFAVSCSIFLEGSSLPRGCAGFSWGGWGNSL
jgi:hypothetical protein